jgi:UDP-N-acetylglucosamine acyltransferase
MRVEIHSIWSISRDYVLHVTTKNQAMNPESKNMTTKTNVHLTSIISLTTIIGNSIIGPYCVIGSLPEDKGSRNNKGVEIGDQTIIHGCTTIDGGSINATKIGERCYIMKQVHIGHDAIIEDDVTISPGAKIGGHAQIGKHCNIGMNAVIHQHVKIPEGCMIGAGAFIGKNHVLKPYGVYINAGEYLRENTYLINKLKAHE